MTPGPWEAAFVLAAGLLAVALIWWHGRRGRA